jgi:hypothetical protein
MITLTRDLNVFTSCITTNLSAVFFSIRDIAQAWNMCALSGVLFHHFLLLCSDSSQLHPNLQTPTRAIWGFCKLSGLAVKVSDVVSVGRLIAASVFGRLGSATFTNRRQRSGEPNKSKSFK